MKKTGFTVTKGENVDAPVINEMPISLECKGVSMVADGNRARYKENL